MSTASTIGRGNANSGGPRICPIWKKSCTASPLQEAISDLIKFQNPHKAWALVADLFALKERSAKYRLDNTASYTIEELQVLFQGENGRDYLDAMMADATPAWWLWTKQVMAQAEKRRMAAEATQDALILESQLQPTAAARRLTKGTADATKKLNSAFARKETALGLLRPDSDRPVHRAVAQAKGRR